MTCASGARAEEAGSFGFGADRGGDQREALGGERADDEREENEIALGVTEGAVDGERLHRCEERRGRGVAGREPREDHAVQRE